MTIQEIEEMVREIIVEQLRVDVCKVTYEAHFANDLGADSLDLFELLMAIEEQFNVIIPDDLAHRMGPTLSDAYNVFFESAIGTEFIKRFDLEDSANKERDEKMSEPIGDLPKERKEDQAVNVLQLNQAKDQQVTSKRIIEKKNFNNEIFQMKRNIENLDVVEIPYKSIDPTLDNTLFEEFKLDFKREMSLNNKNKFLNDYFLPIFENYDFDALLFLYNKDFLRQLKDEYYLYFRLGKEKKDEKIEDQFISMLSIMGLAIDKDEEKQKIKWNDKKELGLYSHLLLFSAKYNFSLFKNLFYNIFNNYDEICGESIVIKTFKRLGDHFLPQKEDMLKSYEIALSSYKMAFILNNTFDEAKKIEENLLFDIIRGVCNSYYGLRDFKNIITFMVDKNKKWKYPQLHKSWLASGYIPYANEFAHNSPKRKEYICDFYEVLQNTYQERNETTQQDNDLCNSAWQIISSTENDLCNSAWFLRSLLYGILLEEGESFSKIEMVEAIFEKSKKIYLSDEKDYQYFLDIVHSYCHAIFYKVTLENLDISAIDDAFSAIDVFMNDYYNYNKKNNDTNLETKMIKNFDVHYRISKIKNSPNDGCKLNVELSRLIRCLYVVCEIIKSHLVFKRNNDEKEEYADVVYYTTLDALYYMLEDKRNKTEEHPSDLGKFQQYKFPVFNVRYLNDPDEGKLLFDGLNQMLKDKCKPRFSDFYEKWLLKKEEKDSFIFDDKMVFVKSFSRIDKNAEETKDKESIPMWSHYGNDSKGCRVKLGISTFRFLGKDNKKSKDFPFRADDDYSLYNIIYCSDSGNPIFKENEYIKPYFDMLEKIIANILDFYNNNDIPRNNDNTCKNCSKDYKCLDTTKIIYDILTPFAYLFKSANYDYERELRVIFNRSDEITHKEFKEILEKPFPRICIFMDNEVAIEEIMLGPKLDYRVIGSYAPFIRVQLEKMKSDAKIVKSDIQLK